LRERKEEIPYLSTTFVKQCCEENGLPKKELSPEALDVLMKYSWPGNIRELRNTIERSVVISEGETIFKEALTSRLTSEYPSERPNHSHSIDDMGGDGDSTVCGRHQRHRLILRKRYHCQCVEKSAMESNQSVRNAQRSPKNSRFKN
jgi:DNA-binding NtrC family response regulator